MIGLCLVYHFNSSQNQDGMFRPARYKLVYFFHQQGFLDDTLLKELAKSVPEADHEQLTFLSLDELKAFALRVAEELESSAVRLISVQDYNIGVDGARDKKGFQSIFENFGEIVENEDHQRRKGFFGKLFS